MSENPSSKRSLIISVAVILVVVIVLVLLNWEGFPVGLSPDPSALEDEAASEIATMAVESIFSVDYREGKETWLARICEVSTKAGCDLLTASSDAIWQKYLSEKTVVGAARYGMEKLADRTNEQVWKMEITLSAPLPGNPRTEDSAYILLVKQDGTWKFDRFLFPQEIRSLHPNEKVSQ